QFKIAGKKVAQNRSRRRIMWTAGALTKMLLARSDKRIFSLEKRQVVSKHRNISRSFAESRHVKRARQGWLLGMTLMLSLGPVSPAMAQFGILKKLIPSPPSEETMTLPRAPEPTRDLLIPPPSEDLYFPIRPDGQPNYLNLENTVNLTEYLNRLKYNHYDE